MNTINSFENFTYFMPDVILIFGIITSLFAGFAFKNLTPKRHLIILNTVLFLMLISFLPLLTVFLKLTNLNIFSNMPPADYYNLTFLHGSINITPLNVFFKFLVTISAFITSLLSFAFVKKLNKKISNFTSLFLFAILGGYGICVSGDLITMFLSIEILSAALYFQISTFYNKKDDGKNSLEGGMKYFIMNSFAVGFMLLGISYIYTNLGTVNFQDINTMMINKILPSSPLLNIGNVLLFLSLTFYIGAFPFYMWVMDVFKGSNYSTGLFITSVVELSGIIALIKTSCTIGCHNSISNFALVLCAVFTLIIGNLIAFRIVKKQGDIKDFLASISISSVGFILLGIAFFTRSSITSSVFFLIIYLISIFGLWAGFMLIIRSLRKFTIKNNCDTKKIYIDENLNVLKGIAYIAPFFTTLFTICILSLAGFPVMAGFTSKFFLFTNILKCGIQAVYPLLFASIASVICVCYCFKTITVMFQKPDNLKIYKKKAIFNKLNIYIFILSVAAFFLITGFFFSSPLINILNNLM